MNICRCIGLAAVVVLLTGCWNKYEVQNVIYATAIGVDYEENRLAAYVQLIDFSSVAKLEGQQKAEPVPVWVGKTYGTSIT